jgi:hypothetical protein
MVKTTLLTLFLPRPVACRLRRQHDNALPGQAAYGRIRRDDNRDEYYRLSGSADAIARIRWSDEDISLEAQAEYASWIDGVLVGCVYSDLKGYRGPSSGTTCRPHSMAVILAGYQFPG